MDTPVIINADDSPYLRFCAEWWTDPKSKLKAQKADSLVISLGEGGKVLDESYYGQLSTKDGAIQHRQDYTVGGDLIQSPTHMLEQFDVQLDSINHAVEGLSVFLTSSAPLPAYLSKLEFSIVHPVSRELYVYHYREEVSLSTPHSHSAALGTLVRGNHRDWLFYTPTEPYIRSSGIRILHPYASLEFQHYAKETARLLST